MKRYGEKMLHFSLTWNSGKAPSATLKLLAAKWNL